MNLTLQETIDLDPWALWQEIVDCCAHLNYKNKPLESQCMGSHLQFTWRSHNSHISWYFVLPLFSWQTFVLCRVGKPSQGTHEMRTELLWSSISTSHLANSKPTRSQPKDPKVQRCPKMSRDVQRCPDPEEIDPQKSKHSGIAKSSTMCSFCSGFSSNVEL